MAKIRVSSPGTERKEIDFTEGESLGQIFERMQIDVPAGTGIEIWLNGEQSTNWSSRMAQDNDAIVLVPPLKGASEILFVLRAGRVS